MPSSNRTVRPNKKLLMRATVLSTVLLGSMVGWDSACAQQPAKVVPAGVSQVGNPIAELTRVESLRVSTRRSRKAQSPKEQSSPSDGAPKAELEEAPTIDDEPKPGLDVSAPVLESEQPSIDSPIEQDAVKEPSDGRKSIAPEKMGLLDAIISTTNTSTASIGTGVVPENTALGHMPGSRTLPDGVERGMSWHHVHWNASNVCYFPLYFEDAMLERHGHERWGIAQPLVSGVKFISTIPLLPYLTTLQPPCEPRYSLGHFRPGNCAPALRDHLPWDRRAATVEVLSLGGYFWAMPL